MQKEITVKALVEAMKPLFRGKTTVHVCPKATARESVYTMLHTGSCGQSECKLFCYAYDGQQWIDVTAEYVGYIFGSNYAYTEPEHRDPERSIPTCKVYEHFLLIEQSDSMWEGWNEPDTDEIIRLYTTMTDVPNPFLTVKGTYTE